MNKKAAIKRVRAEEGQAAVSSRNEDPFSITVSSNQKEGIMSTATLGLKVIKVHRLPEGGRIKAFVDLSVADAFLIKGVRIIEGKKGLFISMPTEQGKNERWYERIRCTSAEIKQEVTNAVLAAYKG